MMIPIPEEDFVHIASTSRDCQMIRLCWLIALAVCFLSIGVCFVIEPTHARSPHRRSPVMMAASRSTDEDSNHHHHHFSAPMEMSRRGFMSSLAAIAFLPSPLLAANSPPEVSDTAPPGTANLKRNNSTHTAIRPGSRSRAAASNRYHNHETHHEDEDHKDGRKGPKVKVKPTGGKSIGKRTPPRIKGLARGELFLKISEVLV
mmetsp:Transcript_33136/g.80080  ORF Transcript_33136/g.80080 Transcript_33136/m.80080 type:complete len:203 (+) Transcript_33136:1722-2330(+)